MGTPMRAEIDTPLMVRGTKLRLQDHEVPRSFVAMEVTTAERIVNKGSVAGIYDDAVALGPLPASVGSLRRGDRPAPTPLAGCGSLGSVRQGGRASKPAEQGAAQLIWVGCALRTQLSQSTVTLARSAEAAARGDGGTPGTDHGIATGSRPAREAAVADHFRRPARRHRVHRLPTRRRLGGSEERMLRQRAAVCLGWRPSQPWCSLPIVEGYVRRRL